MNSGHGWVYPRADGHKARCGGPAICQACAADEARRAREVLFPDYEATVRLWSEKGRAIEGGWQAFSQMALRNASPEQFADMRKAFYAGAQHCFTCLASVAHGMAIPGPDEFLRVEQIGLELTQWRHQELKR